MNSLQIIGFIIITVGTILSFWGSYIQSGEEMKFQNTITEFVDTSNNENKPDVKALNIIKSENNDYSVLLKNIGKQPAKNVKIIFDDSSSPSIFSSNMISGIEEIPQGVECSLPLNLFSGITLTLKMLTSDKEYIENFKVLMTEFNEGKKAFIPRFHIEYYFNKKKIESETYFLVLESSKGITYFGKN